MVSPSENQSQKDHILEVLWENPLLTFFQLLKLPACLSQWFPSSTFTGNNHMTSYPSNLFHCNISFRLASDYNFLLRILVITLGPLESSRTLPHLKVLNFVPSSKSLLSCKGRMSQPLGIKVWTSLWSHFLPTTEFLLNFYRWYFLYLHMIKALNPSVFI